MPSLRKSPGPAWRIPVTGKALAAFLGLCPGSAEACRLALLLALDVSSSVDAREDALQRTGLAAALNTPEVREAILSSGPVALAAYEWSGRWQQHWILTWRLIRSPEDLNGAIATIGASQRVVSQYPTALGYALAWGARAFDHAPSCTFRTIDVSGDGENNEGYVPATAYGSVHFTDITVNGLVIGGDPNLLAYFHNEVLRGPFAFAETAIDYSDFARAMRRKLMRELAPRAIGALK